MLVSIPQSVMGSLFGLSRHVCCMSPGKVLPHSTIVTWRWFYNLVTMNQWSIPFCHFHYVFHFLFHILTSFYLLHNSPVLSYNCFLRKTYDKWRFLSPFHLHIQWQIYEYCKQVNIITHTMKTEQKMPMAVKALCSGRMQKDVGRRMGLASGPQYCCYDGQLFITTLMSLLSSCRWRRRRRWSRTEPRGNEDLNTI